MVKVKFTITYKPDVVTIQVPEDVVDDKDLCEEWLNDSLDHMAFEGPQWKSVKKERVR